jgi:hypothetical protein
MISQSWQEAKSKGEVHYYTGKPCRRGHDSKRYTSTRQCLECQYIRSAIYSKSDHGKLKSKERHLSKTYNLSYRHVSQQTHCDICEDPFVEDSGAKMRCVDHDHITGKVRGIICNNCNRAMGLMADDPTRLIKAANYLLNNADKEIPTEWLK